jgi:hypothetical protein
LSKSIQDRTKYVSKYKLNNDLQGIGSCHYLLRGDMGAIALEGVFYAKTMLRYAENRLIKLKFWNYL